MIRAVLADRPFLLEAFVASNLAFLVLDVWIAHSINAFAHPAEWIPIAAAAPAAAALALNLAASRPLRRGGRRFDEGAGRAVGLGAGGAMVAVGVAGLLWHLDGHFFRETTLRSLVYSAPFVAPLSFAGLGFALLLGRLVPAGTREWGRWVVFLAWGGFLGCFALALADHAQNGFFHPAEWIAVAGAALATGFLAIPLLARVPPGYVRPAAGAVAAAAGVGALGFVLHLLPALDAGSGAPLADRLLHGPPPFAPLLLADLALLAAIGLAEVAREG